MTDKTVSPVTRIFTFGYGDVCPHTGVNLCDHYVTITAPEYEQCRTLMIHLFGKAWCTDYSGIDDPRLRGHGARMTEHARLVLGPAVADTGMDFSDLADRLNTEAAPVPTTTAGWANGDRSGALVEVHPAEPAADSSRWVVFFVSGDPVQAAVDTSQSIRVAVECLLLSVPGASSSEWELRDPLGGLIDMDQPAEILQVWGQRYFLNRRAGVGA